VPEGTPGVSGVTSGYRSTVPRCTPGVFRCTPRSPRYFGVPLGTPRSHGLPWNTAGCPGVPPGSPGAPGYPGTQGTSECFGPRVPQGIPGGEGGEGGGSGGQGEVGGGGVGSPFVGGKRERWCSSLCGATRVPPKSCRSASRSPLPSKSTVAKCHPLHDSISTARRNTDKFAFRTAGS
jgi:hypothetical protein